MNHKALREVAILCALLFYCLGCSAAAPVITYSRIIIDTYNPTDGTSLAGSANYLELWSSDGKTLLAHDDGSAQAARPTNQFYAYLDYNGGLTSGDYWVLVLASSPGDSVDYGIRVLTAPDSSYAGWAFGGPASETISDQPLTGGSGIPSTFQTIKLSNSTSDRLNRFIISIVPAVSSGVNWIKLTLP